jgi:hypothetical protein
MGNQVTIDKEYHNIIYKSNLHWLKLDLKIDTNKIWNEIKLFEDYGKQSSMGWEGLAYRGIDLNKMRPHTNYGYDIEDDVPYIWTELATKAPTLRNLLEAQFPNTKFYRIKINKLLHRGVILPHNDSRQKGLGLTEHSPYKEIDPYRIKYMTIALDWPEEVEFYLGRKRLPIKTGDVFLLDFSQIHEVYNYSGKDRVSAIFTGRLDESDEFKNLVVNSYKNHKHQADHVRLKKMTFSAFLRTRAISLSKRFFAKIR